MLYIFYMTAKQEKSMSFATQFIISCISVDLFVSIFFFLFGHYPGGTRVAVPGYPRRLLPCNIEFNLSEWKTFKNKCSFQYINVSKW